MNLMNIKLGRILQRRDQILDNIDKNKLTEYINSFIYPAGAIPFHIVENNKNYLMHTEEENAEYFNNFVHFVFNDLYTDEEYNVICQFLLIRIYSINGYSNDMIENLRTAFKTETDKAEITYLIEELKFRLLSFFTVANRNLEEADELLAELEPIENAHNKFKINIQADL